MNNELATQENKLPSVFDSDQFDHWHGIAQKLASSEMIPPNYKGKPMDILISIEMGRQVGLGMMQALQSIAVINRVPCMYGDAPLAVCQNHPSYEWIKEEPIVSGNTVNGYRCTVKRRNNEEHTVVFTIDNAKKAGLWGKPGPWSQYPERMMQMRARGFALRNTFPDALKGIKIKEEVEDMQVIDAVWEPKKNQQDKMQELLNKKMKSLLTNKGFKNEGTIIDNESSDNDSYPININKDADILTSDSNVDLQSSVPEITNTLGANGTSESSVQNKEDAPEKCSEEQLESIIFLIDEKKVDKTHQLKFLDHFNVASFDELSEKQAKAVIKKLNGME